jgi:hypothetical protein
MSLALAREKTCALGLRSRGNTRLRWPVLGTAELTIDTGALFRVFGALPKVGPLCRR